MNRQKSYQSNSAKLYLVATPIGNLGDITYRAVETLKTVDVCFAEDTRVSRVLFDHYNIHTRLECYQEHNKETQYKAVLNYLAKGISVALVSDAGMPIISDPGYFVAKEAIKAGYDVVPIPGASASLSALIISGITPQPFTFYGFLDSKSSKRKKELEILKEHKETIIFYEAPHRIKEMLTDLLNVFGDREIALAREITKKFEEVVRGKVSEIIEITDTLKGEMVVVCSGYVEDNNKYANVDPIAQVDELIVAGVIKNDAIKMVAKRIGITKQELYKAYSEKKNN
jgi:16S rRNA (cytidine1402-2'-O)-methyltransferase